MIQASALLKALYVAVPSFWLYSGSGKIAGAGFPSGCEDETTLSAQFACLSQSASGTLVALEGHHVHAGAHVLVGIALILPWGIMVPVVAMYRLTQVSKLKRE